MGVTLDTGAALSPVALFLQADWIVRLVMIGLIAASMWSWTIIVSAWRAMCRVRDQGAAADTGTPHARIREAGLAELQRGADKDDEDPADRRASLGTVLDHAVEREVEALARGLNILATIGSVAPFVGLFGTVWGIMRAFTGIASAQNTSLAVVAPGIAEALFATAIGLFAAIPAVIAYNRLGHMLDGIEAALTRHAEELHDGFRRAMRQERR